MNPLLCFVDFVLLLVLIIFLFFVFVLLLVTIYLHKYSESLRALTCCYEVMQTMCINPAFKFIRIR